MYVPDVILNKSDKTYNIYLTFIYKIENISIRIVSSINYDNDQKLHTCSSNTNYCYFKDQKIEYGTAYDILSYYLKIDRNKVNEHIQLYMNSFIKNNFPTLQSVLDVDK